MKKQHMKRWLAGFLAVVTAMTMTLGQTAVTTQALTDGTAVTAQALTDGPAVGTQALTDGPAVGTQALTDASAVGTQALTDGPAVGTQALTDGTEAGTQPAADDMTADTQPVADGTEADTQSVADGAIDYTQSVADDMTDDTQPVADDMTADAQPAADGATADAQDDAGSGTSLMLPAPGETAEESDPAAGEPVVQDLGDPTDINSLVRMDTVYVGEEDEYNTIKTGDFTVKYQTNLNIKSDIAAGQLTIRIPRTLLTKRDGSDATPTDIGVPMGTPESYVENRVSPFNYYVDEEKKELVFFNYRTLTEGSSASFQVAYNDIKAMDVPDMTMWSLTPTMTVSHTGEGAEVPEELTYTSPTLNGTVDTSVSLSSAEKTSYKDPASSNITPELYTENQVKRYLYNGELPEAFSGENYDNYVYMIWEMKFSGEASQPWNLYVTETPSIDDGNPGQVVGFNYPSELQEDGRYLLASDVRKAAMAGLYQDTPLRVVTAYPKAEAPEGTKLNNTAVFTAEPVDGKDPESTADADASWAYREFKFTYPDGWVDVEKKSKEPLMNRPTVQTPTYSGLLEQYRLASENGQDTDALSYVSTSTARTYAATHNVDQSSSDFGKYIPDTWAEITTVDDVMRLQDDNGNIVMLGKDDYYYTSVQIRQTDVGLDPWEETDAPSDVDDSQNAVPLDRSVTIYAWYADGTDWEEVANVPWSADGVMEYAFTDSDLQRQPWRIKVVHNAADDTSTCSIDVNAALRAGSPAMESMLNAGAEVLTTEDLSGVIYNWHKNEANVEWINEDEDTNGSYADSQELQDTTSALYGGLIQRDNASIKLTGLEKDAAAYKSGTATNDAANARVNLQYNLTAYESYLVYSSEAIRELASLGTQGPSRREVVFYDLLPLGVKYDPSVEIKAGRIPDLDANGYYKTRPTAWDSSQVSVFVDSSADIIENYRGTGRTRVAIHVRYDGVDPSAFSSQRWLAGWGVSFGAYYDWKDMELCKNSENISAFMPETGDNTALLGTDEQVAADDGVVVPDSLAAACGPFGADIDGDGNTEERNILYAETITSADVSVANEAKIFKTVKADDDRFGTYSEKASVIVGGGYSYDITISNTQYKLKDIVIFDRVEYASQDHDPKETDIEGTSWKGTFAGLQLADLKKLGITPVVYYNANENAPVSEGSTSAAEVLTAANGWYTEAAWTAAGKTLADVRSFAVDASRTAGGEDFILTKNAALSLQVQMISPASLQDETYAYNNARFYSYNTEAEQASTGLGNTVRVTLSEKDRLEVVKTFEGVIPESRKESVFTFTVKKDGKACATQEYTLWTQQEDGTYTQQTGRIYTTTAAGTFTLKAGQKAVFEAADVDALTVTEAESPFWKQTTGDTKIVEGVRTLGFINAYRPVLYAQKKLKALPRGLDTTDEAFTYQILDNGQPVADAEFWYVTSARTDGGVPARDTTKGTAGIGHTDADGCFTIKAGEIIALFPGAVNDAYTLKETDPGENWICQTDTVEGTLQVNGAIGEITNIYKWKTLNLTKNLTHQDAEACTQAFTFRIEVDGQPFADKPWALLNADGTPAKNELGIPITGTTNENGELTAACAGKLLQIPGIAAESEVTVTETDSGDEYEPEEAEVSGTMPLYAVSRDLAITNDYLYRDLSVTKQVGYDPGAADAAQIETDLETRAFTMTAEIGGEPLSDTPYTITKGSETVGTGTTAADGSFPIKHGQTVTFADVAKEGMAYKVTETPDADYPQLVPAENAPVSGKIGNEGASVTILNGQGSDFIIEKQIVRGADNNDRDALNWIDDAKTHPSKKTMISIKLRVTEADGTVYSWPKADTMVTEILPDGTTASNTWTAGQAYDLHCGAKVIISGGLQGISYTIKESVSDPQLLEGKKGILTAKQISPKDAAPLKGEIAASRQAVLVNEISAYDFTSTVDKKMRSSKKLAENDKLVYEIQRYDGTKWSSAEGISYVRYSSGWTDKVFTTEADGLITVKYSEDAPGFPTVAFIGDTVKPYHALTIPGALRVIERPDLSDAVCGMQSGYIDKDGKEMDVASEDAAGFINDNSSRTIEIAKEMSDGSTGTDTYTFYLEQILAAAAKPVTDESQIRETHAWPGMAYTVYNTETGACEGSGVTDESGAVCLKAGQYASLSVPEKTEWTVTEKNTAMTTLTDLSGTEGDTSRLDDNLMLIMKKELELPDFVDHKIINMDDGYKIWDGRIQAVYGFAEGDLTKTRISDSDGGFSEGLNMPEYYYDTTDGKYYRVTGIGYYGFNQFGDVGDLVLPDSVESIGTNAFVNLRFTSITFGNGLKSIEVNAFFECMFNNIGTLKFPEGMEMITMGEDSEYFSMFYGCAGEPFDVIIPSTVTSIGRLAFLVGYVSLWGGSNEVTVKLKSIKIAKPEGSISGAPWGAEFVEGGGVIWDYTG